MFNSDKKSKNHSTACFILFISTLYISSAANSALYQLEEDKITFSPQFTSEQTSEQLMRQGVQSLKMESTDIALEQLQTAWEKDPGLTSAAVLISLTYLKNKEYKQALDIALQLQEIKPTDPQNYTLAGIAYMGLNDEQQSINAFKKAIEINPGDLNASSNLAAYEIAKKNINEARILYTNILKYNPDHLDTQLKLAILDAKHGHQASAISLLQKSITQHKSEIQAHILLIKIYLLNNNTKKASEHSAIALNSFPDNVALMELAGIIEILNGHPEQASILLNKAIQLHPDFNTLYYYLGRSYGQLKQYPKAISSIEMSLKINPEHIASKFFLAGLLAQSGQLDVALDHLNVLSQSFPSSFYIPELQGKIALAQNRPSDAITFFTQALALSENNFTLLQLAASQIKAGETNKAYLTLNSWLDKYPDDILTRSALADIYLAQEQFDLAQHHYKKILSLQADNFAARNNLALVLLQKKSFDEALVQAQKAYSFAPNNPQIMDTIGEILLEKNQPAEAMSFLTKAAELSPDSTAIRFHLAQSLAYSENTNEAKKILISLLAHNQPFSERQAAQELLHKLESR